MRAKTKDTPRRQDRARKPPNRPAKDKQAAKGAYTTVNGTPIIQGKPS